LAWVFVVLCDFDALCVVDDDDSVAIGLVAAGAEAAWANAPTLTAEAMIAARRVFMEFLGSLR
jgi:hypothetical protein